MPSTPGPDANDGRAWTIPPPQPPRRRRRWLWGCLPLAAVGLVVLGLVLILLTRANDSTIDRPGGTALPSNAPTTEVPGSTALTSSCNVTQGLVTRECAIITPPDVPAGTRLPVVFLLHGFAEGPGAVRDAGRWTDAVVARRFVLVTPSGVANSWNAGGCCGIASGTGIDDMSYLATLLDEVARRPDVDPDRIYLAGFSNGGMMTYRFACVSDRLAGIASVSGTPVIECPPKRSIPILHIHGTADETVPYEGGAGLAAVLLGVSFRPVPDALQSVATADGCTAAPSDRTIPAGTIEEWDGCGGGARVRLVSLTGVTHLWPTGSFDATDEVLDFFGIS